MVERTTVRLPEELLRRAKRKAAAEGRTLTSLIEDGLRNVLADRKPETEKPALPRVCSASLGQPTQPGFLKFSEYQELEDEEYVERMKHFK